MEHGKDIYEHGGDIFRHDSIFIPPTHYQIMAIALELYIQSPACFAAIVSPVIEHSLRLLWCEANKRDEMIARLEEYYVTLDGHGQKDKHEMLLKPYTNGLAEKNMLIDKIGGTAIALLTDLFASSCGGPNIRASISHGVFDKFILSELGGVGSTNPIDISRSPLKDISYILFAALQLLESRTSKTTRRFPEPIEAVYRPTFSYAAATSRDLNKILKCIVELRKRMDEIDNVDQNAQRLLHKARLNLIIPLEEIQYLKESLFGGFDRNRYHAWSADDVFAEYFYNVNLVNCGASRKLLSDVSEALEKFTDEFKSLEKKLYENELTGRGLKKYSRICSHMKVVIGVYSFSTYVALLHIQKYVDVADVNEEDKTDSRQSVKLLDLKTVERARMCVSTFSTFLTSNSDRAMKAVDSFVLSKGVRYILAQKSPPRESYLRRNSC